MVQHQFNTRDAKGQWENAENDPDSAHPVIQAYLEEYSDAKRVARKTAKKAKIGPDDFESLIPQMIQARQDWEALGGSSEPRYEVRHSLEAVDYEYVPVEEGKPARQRVPVCEPFRRVVNVGSGEDTRQRRNAGKAFKDFKALAQILFYATLLICVFKELAFSRIPEPSHLAFFGRMRAVALVEFGAACDRCTTTTVGWTRYFENAISGAIKDELICEREGRNKPDASYQMMYMPGAVEKQKVFRRAYTQGDKIKQTRDRRYADDKQDLADAVEAVGECCGEQHRQLAEFYARFYKQDRPTIPETCAALGLGRTRVENIRGDIMKGYPQWRRTLKVG